MTRVICSLGSWISWRLLPVEKDSSSENCVHTYDSKLRCVLSFASFSWQHTVLGQVQWANLLETRPCKRTTTWDCPPNILQILFSWEWSLWWKKTFSTTILLAWLFTFGTILRTSWHGQSFTNDAVIRLLIAFETDQQPKKWDKHFVGGRNSSQEISWAPHCEDRIRRSLPLPQLWEVAREQLWRPRLAGGNKECELGQKMCEQFETKVCSCFHMV